MLDDNLKSNIIKQYRNRDSTIENNDIIEYLPNCFIADFWDWFVRESVLFNGDKVEWESMSFAERETTYGRCHYNSIMNSIDGEYELFSGLVAQKNKGESIRIILHSFNVKDGRAFDFTYFFNKDEKAFTYNIFPFDYIGIKIPKIVLNKIKEKYLPEEKSQNAFYLLDYPLVIPTFLATQNQIDWMNAIHTYFPK